MLLLWLLFLFVVGVAVTVDCWYCCSLLLFVVVVRRCSSLLLFVAVAIVG